MMLQASILIAGIVIFIALTGNGYRAAIKRFPKVEM